MGSIQTRPGPRYRVQVRLKGRYRSATLPTLEHARRWATQTEHALYEQHHFPGPDSARHTVQELLERYSRGVLPRKRPGTQAHQATQLAWWQQQLGALRLDQVTPARLTACRARLAETRAPATVNRYLAVLRHAFAVAMQE